MLDYHIFIHQGSKFFWVLSLDVKASAHVLKLI